MVIIRGLCPRAQTFFYLKSLTRLIAWYSGLTDLNWTEGNFTDSHDVYFGTDMTPDADNGSSEFIGNQIGSTTYDPPGNLLANTTYYWRIDEVNLLGTTDGDVWSFTTGPDANLKDFATVAKNWNDPYGVDVLASLAMAWLNAQWMAPDIASKTILVISETNDVAGVDKIYLDALGAGPVTIPGGGTVPGLGYNVVLFDDDNYTETTFTNADGDLVFIFMSSGSASLNDTHADDPLPVISMEPFICDNRTGRGSFWFTDTAMETGGEGPTYILDVGIVITDNSHPITSIFPLGQLTMFTAPQRQHGMRGTFGSGVQVLGVDTQGTPEVLLAVADAGATLAAGAPDTISPAPAKRAIMSIHEDSYESATKDAVFIFQRMVQWAIGDPVVAGDTP